MTNHPKLRLVVRSEKMTRIVEFEVPLMSVYGKVGVTKKRAMVYDYVLDERQSDAVGQARELASSFGIPLEVTDLAQENALKRMIRLVSGRGGRAVLPQLTPPSLKMTERVDQELAVTSPVARP